MNVQPDKSHVLKGLPMFAALDQMQLHSLASACRTLRLPQGRQIFGPGEAAESFFVILEGRVRVYKLSPRGDEQILHLYGRGENFGEAAMLARKSYPAYAQTLAPSRLLSVPRSAIESAIARSPGLALAMMAGMAAKLREFATLIERLSLRDVPARLAGILLEQQRSAGTDRFKLTVTKRQLAGRIGTVPETLSRALAKLKSAGLIDVQGSQITIINSAALADIAQGQ